MSRLSIFDTAWADIVFEGRNREYGAYQLRKENPRTTLTAFLIALAGASLLVLISTISSLAGSSVIPTPTLPPITTIDLRDVVYPDPPPPPLKNKDITPPVHVDEPTSQKPFKDPEVVSPDEGEEPGKVDAPVAPDAGGPADGAVSGPATAAGGVPGGSETDTSGGEGTHKGPVRIEILDKMPSYPGGNANFKNEIARRFNTPEDEFAAGSVVTVELTFVIETDGTLSNIKVVRSSGKSLDKEALRVLKSMTKKWEPGYYKGKPVSVVFKQAIKLRVQ